MRYRIPTLAAAIVVALPALGAQQAGVTALPDSIVVRVDRAFATLGGKEAPGCAIGLSKDGQPVLTRAYGMANLEYGVPNTPETIFETGSVAKQFTAAAMVLLAQDGKLSLDDDIRKHLPEVPDFGVKITIRNLLTHTSGLRDQWGLLGLKGMGPGTQVHSLATILDLVQHQKRLNFDPGSEYLYSNTGYALAAIIVQRASGSSLAKFSEERLFKPIGMTNTQWRDDFTRIVKNRATAYDGTVQRGFRTNMPFTNVYGNGGLLTTVGDLLKWNVFLDNPTILPGGATLVETLQTQMTLTNGRKIAYALGVSVGNTDGIREVTHGGSTAGYATWLARYPDRKVSVAVLCNTANASPTGYGNAATTLLLGRVPLSRVTEAGDGQATLPADQLQRYAGLFRSPATQLVVRTSVRNGTLVTQMPTSLTLSQTGRDRFRVPGQGELIYHFRGDTLAALQMVSGEDTTAFDIMSGASPSPRELAEYAGSYWSDELETRVAFEVQDTVLVARQRPADQATLRPTFRDAFVGSGIGTVVFTRDAGGKVTGFGVWAGRVRNVEFRKESPR